MAKADLKTKSTGENVAKFLDGITDEKRRKDCYTVLKLMREITKAEPKMWGDSIVGFGRYHYIYESGREGEWFLTGFSPRKQNLTIYIMAGFEEYAELMSKLGKYKTGKSCLYIKKLEDIELSILKKLIKKSVDHISKKYS
jgi:hypothetical protein